MVCEDFTTIDARPPEQPPLPGQENRDFKRIGDPLWTGMTESSFWDVKWGARDMCAAEQDSIASAVMRAVANDLRKNQLTG